MGIYPSSLRSLAIGSVGVLMLLATLALSVAASGTNRFSFDVALTRDAQSIETDATYIVVTTLNWFGHAEPFLIASTLIGVGLAMRRHFADAALVVSAAVLAQGINALLKLYFASPRPPASLTSTTEQASGLGFPSGHTMSIVVMSICLGFLAWRHLNCRWRRTGVVAISLFAVLAMGFSRVYVGQHWPTDVLGAYLWGTLLGVALIYSYTAIRSQSPSQLLCVGTGDQAISYRVRPVERYEPLSGVCARHYDLSPLGQRRRERNY